MSDGLENVPLNSPGSLLKMMAAHRAGVGDALDLLLERDSAALYQRDASVQPGCRYIVLEGVARVG